MKLYGGEGSVHAVLGELPLAAGQLRRCGNLLDEYAGGLWKVHGANLSQLVGPRLGLIAPVTTVLTVKVAGEVLSLQARAVAVAAATKSLVSGVERAFQAYEQLETNISVRFNELARYPYLVQALGAVVTGNRPGLRETEYVLNNLPAYAGDALYLLAPAAFMFGTAMAGPIGGTLAAGIAYSGARVLPLLRDQRHGGVLDTSVAERLYPAIVQVGISAGKIDHGPVVVDSLGDEKSHQLQGNFADMVGLIEMIDELESILVTRVHHDDGSVVGIVSFPGTQQQNGDQNPFDISGLAESMTLGSQHTAVAVMEALENAGIPQGSQIILNGYSQGGTHAINIAADERFNAVYSPAMVVTVGSPVGQLTEQLAQEVKTFHVEHKDDPVPGLDGRSNPHSIDRLTLQVDGYSVPTVDDSLFGPGHNLQNYRIQLQNIGQHPDSDDDLHLEVGRHEGTLSTLVGAGAGTVAMSRQIKLRRQRGDFTPAPLAPSARRN